MNKSTQSNILDGAKKLFIQELEGQILQVKSWLDQKEFSPEEVKLIKSLFHKIKGGASFFSFADLQDISDQLQKHCESERKSSKWIPVFKNLLVKWLENTDNIVKMEII